MEDNVAAGLGSGAETQPRQYFYLVYNSSHANIGKEQKNAYFELGVSTGEDWVFILVDDATDNRLRSALEISSEGRNLHARIREAVPCFVFADGRLKSNKRIENAEVYPIREFGKDIERIYEKMGVQTPVVRRRAVAFLKDANKIVRLNPNIFGVGIDINAAISRLIDRPDDSTQHKIL